MLEGRSSHPLTVQYIAPRDARNVGTQTNRAVGLQQVSHTLIQQRGAHKGSLATPTQHRHGFRTIYATVHSKLASSSGHASLGRQVLNRQGGFPTCPL